MLSDQLNRDLKASLLARDDVRVTTLRSLKSALTYASVEVKSKGGSGELAEDDVLEILAKEAKKRQESIDAFLKGGAKDRAERELVEKRIIESYLPEQLSDSELSDLVDRAIAESGASDAKQIGRVFGLVKKAAGSRADGSRIALVIKERLA